MASKAEENRLRKIWEKTSGHCHFCGDPVEFEKRGRQADDLTGYWEVDHVIQRGKGGSKYDDNCLPACTECNKRRWHRTGVTIRELIDLGIMARNELAKGTATGMLLAQLRDKQDKQKKARKDKDKLKAQNKKAKMPNLVVNDTEE